MEQNTKHILVIGGGISGLTVAWHLHRAGVDVGLLEAQDGVGGCMRTERRDGFLLEKGPFNVIVRDPAFETLLHSVSDEVGVVTASPSARKRYIYRHGRLLCVPNNPISLATTPLLSLGGKCGLMTGMLLSRRATSEEETIEQVATRRFGKNVSDTMVSAVIAGVFAGDIRKLSLQACFPPAAEVDRKARSLIGYGLTRALQSKRKGARKQRRRYRGLVSLDGGLGALTEVMGKSLGSNLLSGCRVEAVTQTGSGYEVTYRRRDDSSRTIQCHDLVIASPTTEAADLLEPMLPDAASIIRSVESSSLVVMNLGFRRTDVGHPMDGYGFLVPHDETAFALMGVLWADSIFPHHAPQDRRLIRVFIGGARNPEAVSRSDGELVDTAMDSLRGLLQLSGDPTLIDINRYTSAIPQYHVGHVEKIERLRRAIAAMAGLHLVGNYLDGISLNDCIRLSSRVATELIAATSTKSSEPQPLAEVVGSAPG